jgi:DNA-binding response OmpR family regulator
MERCHTGGVCVRMDTQKDWALSQQIGQPLLLRSDPTRIILSPNLWYDQPAATIIRQGKSILLTKREDAILRILLKSPGAWHTASELSRRLKKLSTVPIEAHSIEQLIYGLRRKLGESGKQPCILLSHYGHGYCIRLPETPS